MEKEIAEQLDRMESKLNALLKLVLVTDTLSRNLPYAAIIDESIDILGECISDSNEMKKLANFLRK